MSPCYMFLLSLGCLRRFLWFRVTTARPKDIGCDGILACDMDQERESDWHVAMDNKKGSVLLDSL